MARMCGNADGSEYTGISTRARISAYRILVLSTETCGARDATRNYFVFIGRAATLPGFDSSLRVRAPGAARPARHVVHTRTRAGAGALWEAPSGERCQTVSEPQLRPGSSPPLRAERCGRAEVRVYAVPVLLKSSPHTSRASTPLKHIVKSVRARSPRPRARGHVDGAQPQAQPQAVPPKRPNTEIRPPAAILCFASSRFAHT